MFLNLGNSSLVHCVKMVFYWLILKAYMHTYYSLFFFSIKCDYKPGEFSTSRTCSFLHKIVLTHCVTPLTLLSVVLEMICNM